MEGNGEINILCLNEFDIMAQIEVTNKWAKIFKMKPHIKDALVELTEESNKNVEELDGDQENNANPIVSMNQDVHLPKMFAPFRDKKRGWNDQNVKEQLVLYFNTLGYGQVGKCLINTKIKIAENPNF